MVLVPLFLSPGYHLTVDVPRVAAGLADDGHRVMLLDTNYANVSAAKMLGLEAHRANILSEFAEESDAVPIPVIPEFC